MSVFCVVFFIFPVLVFFKFLIYRTVDLIFFTPQDRCYLSMLHIEYEGQDMMVIKFLLPMMSNHILANPLLPTPRQKTSVLIFLEHFLKSQQCDLAEDIHDIDGCLDMIYERMSMFRSWQSKRKHRKYIDEESKNLSSSLSLSPSPPSSPSLSLDEDITLAHLNEKDMGHSEIWDEVLTTKKQRTSLVPFAPSPFSSHYDLYDPYEDDDDNDDFSKDHIVPNPGFKYMTSILSFLKMHSLSLHTLFGAIGAKSTSSDPSEPYFNQLSTICSRIDSQETNHVDFSELSVPLGGWERVISSYSPMLIQSTVGVLDSLRSMFARNEEILNRRLYQWSSTIDALKNNIRKKEAYNYKSDEGRSTNDDDQEKERPNFEDINAFVRLSTSLAPIIVSRTAIKNFKEYYLFKWEYPELTTIDQYREVIGRLCSKFAKDRLEMIQKIKFTVGIFKQNMQRFEAKDPSLVEDMHHFIKTVMSSVLILYIQAVNKVMTLIILRLASIETLILRDQILSEIIQLGEVLAIKSNDFATFNLQSMYLSCLIGSNDVFKSIKHMHRSGDGKSNDEDEEERKENETNMEHELAEFERSSEHSSLISQLISYISEFPIDEEIVKLIRMGRRIRFLGDSSMMNKAGFQAIHESAFQLYSILFLCVHKLQTSDMFERNDISFEDIVHDALELVQKAHTWFSSTSTIFVLNFAPVSCYRLVTISMKLIEKYPHLGPSLHEISQLSYKIIKIFSEKSGTLDVFLDVIDRKKKVERRQDQHLA